MANPLRVPRGSAVVAGAPTASKNARELFAQTVIAHDWDNFLVDVLQRLSVLTPAGTYANNAAALAGGLLVGQVYQTAAGEVRIVV